MLTGTSTVLLEAAKTRLGLGKVREKEKNSSDRPLRNLFRKLVSLLLMQRITSHFLRAIRYNSTHRRPQLKNQPAVRSSISLLSKFVPWAPNGLSLLHPWAILALFLRSPSRLLDTMTTAHHRYLDRTIAIVTQNPIIFPSGFFCDGWGDMTTPERLQEIFKSNRMSVINEIPHKSIMWQPKRILRSARVCIQEGNFASTLPNASHFLPESSRQVFFELVTPIEWNNDTNQIDDTIPFGDTTRPLVVILPGTGEHGYTHRRASLAIPLAKKGVASIVSKSFRAFRMIIFYSLVSSRERYLKDHSMENVNHQDKEDPNYASKYSAISFLVYLNFLSVYLLMRRVSELPILGLATIEESKSLMQYFMDHFGYSRLVLTGGSMGGLHAAMIASVFPHEVGACAWLAPPSAGPVFTEGLLAGSCNWDLLYKEHETKLLDNMLQGQAEVSQHEDSEEYTDPVLEAKRRMRAFLSVTDIDRFPVPKRPDAVMFVVGTEDEYVGFTEPQWKKLREKWQPANFRYLKAGHISGILLEREAFRDTVLEVIDKLKAASIKTSSTLF
jgi:hypothetical protein